MNVSRHKLKYCPFLREKDKREYIVGEALLRGKGVPEATLATLQNVSNDPPDLIFNAKDHGELSIEVTEAVPHDRAAIAQAGKFLKRLRYHLDKLGTKPEDMLNISLHREQFSMPRITEKEIIRVAHWINDNFEKAESAQVLTRIHNDTLPFNLKMSCVSPTAKYTMGDSPISIAIIPAVDAFAYPSMWYQNNLCLQDITGFPIDYGEIKKCMDERIRKKGSSNYRTNIDILVMYAELGMLGFQEISEEVKSNLLKNLSFLGIYILQIAQARNEYLVNVNTVKEHPEFNN